MMLAVRPPEYFPRIAFFALVHAADRFVLADTMQYSRQSFQNRARLRTPGGSQWISIPLKGGQHGRRVSEVIVRRELRDWRTRHWRSIEFNYRSSPYFEFYEPRLREVFEVDSERLVDFTARSVEVLGELLGLTTPILKASDLAGSPDTVESVSTVCGIDQVVVPAEAAAADREAAGDVRVVAWTESPYRQNFDGFIGDVSALDLVLNHGPAAIRRVADYRLLSSSGGQGT
jgi:hypothetical protein